MTHSRWALERYGIKYELDPHVPGFHRPVVLQAGSKSGQTPCLVSPEGCIDNSDGILRWVDARIPAGAPKLYPPELEADVKALCDRYDTVLGAATRVWAYFHLLDTPQLAASMCDGCPSFEQTAFRWGAGFALRMMLRSAFNLSHKHMSDATDTIRAEFASVSELLEDGRPFLCGSTFTAADISFVSLAAPVLAIPYGPAPAFPDGRYPSEAMAVVNELSETPAGKWAHRVWRDERNRVVQTSM